MFCGNLAENESSTSDGGLACEVSEGKQDSIGPFIRKICGIWADGAEDQL